MYQVQLGEKKKKKMLAVGGCADFQGNFGYAHTVCQYSVSTHTHTHTKRQSCRMATVHMFRQQMIDSLITP